MKYPLYKYFYALADFLTLTVAFFVSHEIYNLFFAKLPSLSFNFGVEDYIMVFSVNVLFIFIFHYFHLYKLNVFLTKANQTVVLVKSLVYGVFVIVILSFFLKFSLLTDSRLTITIFFHVALGLLVIERVVVLYGLYKNVLANKVFKRKILIIGAGKSGLFLAQKLSFENMYGAEIIGFADDEAPVGSKVFKGLYVLGTSEDLLKIYSQRKYDEIIICIDKIDYENLMVLIDNCKLIDVSVKVTSDLFGIIPQRIFSEHYENIPVLDVSAKVNINVYRFVKRFVDYIGAFWGIVLLSPFYIIVSLIIKFSSKGPVIYKQIRIGKDGKPFNFYKFRSMKMIDGEDIDRANKMIDFIKNGNQKNSSKIVDHSRITWIGRILRKYSLDELPQLFNVVKGDMSLVGPRPCLPYEYEHYDEWQKRRQSVMPGCTGLWQVSGRSEVNFNDSVIMDLYYINNVTPWLDLQLIFKTIPVMIFARGGK